MDVVVKRSPAFDAVEFSDLYCSSGNSKQLARPAYHYNHLPLHGEGDLHLQSTVTTASAHLAPHRFDSISNN